MGYYTRHELSIVGGDQNEINEFWSRVSKECSYTFEEINYAVGEYGGTSYTWYDRDEHMLEVSKMFTSIIFELTGYGENKGDIWREYYKNGRMQKCNVSIVFEEYDENKLR